MISAQSVSKRYAGGQTALDGVSLEIGEGEFVLVAGRSGAGKSTLLKLIAAIERPSGGAILLRGKNLAALRESAIPYVRRNFGLVFQNQRLLFDRNALDNVLLPLAIAGSVGDEARRRAAAALDKVGLRQREKAMPVALSGGEQQRLAIARAIVNRPAILIADEPTTNLDDESASAVMDLFRDFHRVGTTVIVATHEPAWASRLGARTIALAGGRVTS
jgi:cell division transport system ATP-binding protein